MIAFTTSRTISTAQRGVKFDLYLDDTNVMCVAGIHQFRNVAMIIFVKPAMPFFGQRDMNAQH